MFDTTYMYIFLTEYPEPPLSHAKWLYIQWARHYTKPCSEDENLTFGLFDLVGGRDKYTLPPG